jgi:hypothetical protein
MDKKTFYVWLVKHYWLVFLFMDLMLIDLSIYGWIMLMLIYLV